VRTDRPHAPHAPHAPHLALADRARAFSADYHDEGSSPERYTFRATGTSAASAPELPLGSFGNADAVPDDLSRLHATLSATCADGSSCPDGSSGPDGTPGCCDQNIRVFLSTSEGVRGAPQELTGWTAYDHQERPWYTLEKARAGETGWSSIYVFSSSKELGITRTAKLKRPDGTGTLVEHGVLGIDFELDELSQILLDTVAGSGSWAYVVERGSEAAGMLVGTTFGAPLRDEDSSDSVDTRCLAHGGSCGLEQPTISSSAFKLSQEGWRATAPGEILTNTIPGQFTPTVAKYEATAAEFTLGGLEWLIVVGQNIQCEPHEVWIFGKCEDCPEGQVPRDDRNCMICSEELPGTVSDDGIDGGTGTKCVCPDGSYSIRDGAVQRCERCESLSRSVIGVRSRSEDPVAWGDEHVCPGGVSWQTRICPLNKLWIEIEEPEESDSSTDARTRVSLLTCPACVSAPCINSTTLAALAGGTGDLISPDELSSKEWLAFQPKAVCSAHHTGFLCADCEPSYKAIEGECILCDKTDWHWIATEGLTAVAIGLFLMSKTWHSVCENGLFALFMLKMIILPRQARDNHRQNSKKDCFLSGVQTGRLEPGV
jgi:hypothetical protein